MCDRPDIIDIKAIRNPGNLTRKDLEELKSSCLYNASWCSSCSCCYCCCNFNQTKANMYSTLYTKYEQEEMVRLLILFLLIVYSLMFLCAHSDDYARAAKSTSAASAALVADPAAAI